MLAVSNAVPFAANVDPGGIPLVPPPSEDTAQLIIHSLMCYRQNGESKEFAKRAIESLVKKLKEKREDLDSLMSAITTSGSNPGRCVTIQRTLDGRMQIAGRKCLPHIIYAKIWRWPDLHRNELKHSKFCSFGFEMKRDSVCVNPYHYERLASAVEFGSLSLSPLDEQDHDGPSDSESDFLDATVPTATSNPSTSNPSPMSNEILESRQSVSPALVHSRLTVQSRNETIAIQPSSTDSPALNTRIAPSSVDSSLPPSAGLSALAQCTSAQDRINPPPHPDRGRNTMAWSGVAVPGVPHQSQWCSSPPTISSSGGPQRAGSSQAVLESAHFSHIHDPQCRNGPGQSAASDFVVLGILNSSGNEPAGSNSTNQNPHKPAGASGSGSGSGGRNAACSGFGASASGTPGAGASGGGGGGWNQRGGPPQPPFTPSGSLLQPVPVLTTQRPPEFWCNIAYFELDQQVGELFKVPSHLSRVTVDGYTDPSSPNRFCLGQLSNVHRPEQSERSRLYIGKGVELDNVGEGDVWIRCLSEFSVFVQSYYLDREAGRRPGDAVHKIYPGAYIKVFDIRQCHEQMKLLAHSAQLAAEHQAAVVVGSPIAGAGGPPIPPSLLPPPLPPGPSQSNAMQATTSPVGISPLATADVGVDDLRRLCMLRLSFVKGWGPDYPRHSIKETPCWIEIQLHRPLQLLDEVLQGMPLNDRKPTRHFFPYFSQPGAPAAPRPSLQPTSRRI